MKDDLISRRSAIDALEKEKPTPFVNKDRSVDPFGAGRQNQWYRDGIVIMNLPSAQSSLYGYDLRNLIFFADAVNKKGISDSEIEDFVRSASAAWEYAWEEFQRTQKEALDSIMRGDHHEG